MRTFLSHRIKLPFQALANIVVQSRSHNTRNYLKHSLNYLMGVLWRYTCVPILFTRNLLVTTGHKQIQHR